MRISHAMAILCAGLAAQIATAQQGPPPGGMGTPVSGTLKSVGAEQIVLATPKGDVTVSVTPKTQVFASQSASASDIKPGSYLGTSNQNGAAPNTGTASEIHLGDNGPNVNSPMNNAGLTMTNGHVKAVKHTAAGAEMDVDYGQPTLRHVIVPDSTRITKMVNTRLSDLKPGIMLSAMTTTGADGKSVANMIMVGALPGPSAP